MVNKTYEWISTKKCVYEQSSNIPVQTSKNGLKCAWKVTNKILNQWFFYWDFDWSELKEQGVEGFDGTVRVWIYQSPNHIDGIEGDFPECKDLPKTFSVRMRDPNMCIKAFVGDVENANVLFTRNDICFATHLVLKPIMNTNDLLLLEENFKATDKTDAILVVDGKKLHVNKMFLSIHSEFFNALFNANFREKTMEEIPIEDVGYEDFARLLSVVYPNPIIPTMQTAATLLKLADRFAMPLVIRLVEPLLIRNKNMPLMEKITLADKYLLKELMDSCLAQLRSPAEVKKITKTADFEAFSTDTKNKLFQRILTFV